jgi:hypothetical protein
MRTLFFVLAFGISIPATADDWSWVVPINDLGTRGYRLGLTGGLYENGSNVMAADHFALGLAAASRIQPLDAEGHPSPDGKIGFVAFGFGETSRIMHSFLDIAANDPRVDHSKLVMINAAYDGADYRVWDESPDGHPRYDIVNRYVLAPAGISPLQVQAAWAEIITDHPGEMLGVAAADAFRLKGLIAGSLREMKKQYPNLQVAYLSSRVYGGYSNINFSPEPYAFETGYSNRWVITTQMEQERMEQPLWHWDTRTGLVDDTRSAVVPWLAWGPYLWANGATPREDGLAWLRGDFEADGETLTPSGAVKGAKLLFDFLLHEPTAKQWFLSGLEVTGRGRAARH